MLLTLNCFHSFLSHLKNLLFINFFNKFHIKAKGTKENNYNILVFFLQKIYTDINIIPHIKGQFDKAVIGINI